MNTELIKNEVYKNEKSKIVKKYLFFNITFIIVVFLSLSSASIHPDESKILNKFKKETETVYKERDSLKNILLNELTALKLREKDLIRKSLSISDDINYIDYSNYTVTDLYKEIKNQNNVYSDLNNKINISIDSIHHLPTLTPISSSDLIRITSGFGHRKHPITKKWSFHEGIDISATKRTEVYATSDGIIENVYKNKTGYGNRVIIKHKYGYKTVYAHLSSISVKKGQIIKRNQKIGYVGSTGTSTNNHLHYEILLNNRPVDPVDYIYAYNKNY